MAEQAQREEHTYTRYLEALLAMEVEERERNTVARRIQAARLPRMKTLEDFDFSQSEVPANRIRGLADGGYLERAEPVVLIGECGTGKTHLATGLCVAACRQKKRVRFTTAAGLINELVEAQHNNQLRRVLALLDLHGNIPAFIHVTDGKVHDVNVLDEIALEAGAFYVMDRAYGHYDYGML